MRPPREVTDAIKRRLVNGLPGSSQDYELDHLILLGLGGHPTSSNNLWLQNWPEAAIKDRDELRLHRHHGHHFIGLIYGPFPYARYPEFGP